MLLKLQRVFPQLPPLAKVAIWLGLVVLLAGAVQLAAALCGIEFRLFNGRQQGLLIASALGSLFLVMSLDRRGLADYGLAVEENWARHLFGGFAIGAGFYAGFYLLAAGVGIVHGNTEALTLGKCLRAAMKGLTAFPVATTQQVIFSGYLLSMLRDGHHRVTALCLVSALFASASCLEHTESLAALAPAATQLVVGMFLIALLTGLARLRFGSIPFPAGLLAGAIFVRRVLRATAFVTLDETNPLTAWFLPGGDARRSPVLWAFLTVGIAATVWALRRYGERSPPDRAGIDATFKRVFPFSNLMSFAPLDLWLPQLVDARFRVGLKYLPRLVFILAASTINTVLTLPERLLLPRLVRRRRVPDPVFIVGVHRSGTTHLHNLLALDRQFLAPNNLHIVNAAGFVTTGWLTTLLVGPFLSLPRPMDGMAMSLFTPQEEEFAIAGLSPYSPYWGFNFPRRIVRHDAYIFPDRLPDEQRTAWRETYLYFLRKLTFWSRRRPLLKSPYNTGRVGEFHRLLPGAKFIHIVRDPYRVYQSNRHLAREGIVVFQLQDPDENDCYETRFLDNYAEMEATFYRDAAELPESDVVEIRYEDLERDPIGVIRGIYARLELEFSAEFEQRLAEYLASLEGFQKNRFTTLPADERARVTEKLGPLLKRWGYESAAERRAA